MISAWSVDDLRKEKLQWVRERERAKARQRQIDREAETEKERDTEREGGRERERERAREREREREREMLSRSVIVTRDRALILGGKQTIKLTSSGVGVVRSRASISSSYLREVVYAVTLDEHFV